MKARTLLAIVGALIFVLLIYLPPVTGALIFISIPVAMIYGYRWKYRLWKLSKDSIEEDGSFLIQKSANGHLKATIDLENEYSFSTPYVGYAEAVYRVQQDNQTLEFCTSHSNAEHLIKDIFKVEGEYPPVARWNFGY